MMLSLRQKLDSSRGRKEGFQESRISIRDRLLLQEVQDLEQHIPKTCRIDFADPNKLHVFTLTISPDEGYWVSGKFKFLIDVPEDYNIVPPKVQCLTKIWHPNINEEEVCLSLLRQTSIDSSGWAPTRKLTDVVWGLNSLFSDLLNFDDPLNVEAAEQYETDKEAFISTVKDYLRRYAK